MKAVTHYIADDCSVHATADAALARDWVLAQRRYIADVSGALRGVVIACPKITPSVAGYIWNDATEQLAALYLADPTLFERLGAAAATVARPVKPEGAA